MSNPATPTIHVNLPADEVGPRPAVIIHNVHSVDHHPDGSLHLTDHNGRTLAHFTATTWEYYLTLPEDEEPHTTTLADEEPHPDTLPEDTTTLTTAQLGDIPTTTTNPLTINA